MTIRTLKFGEHVDCERILRALPDWFGIEESLVQYVADAKRFETLVAIGTAEDIIGFVTIRRHFPESGEIHCLAVVPSEHGRGVGRGLVAAVEQRLIAGGAAFLQVKTLGPSRPSEFYARTLAFYRAVGFAPLEELHGLWGAIPCLMLVKKLSQ